MTRTLVVLSALASLLVAPLAGAQPDEVEIGELHISTNAEYCKVYIADEEWSGVEFENSGKRVLVKNLDLSEGSVEVELRPVDDSLEPATISVVRKDFKRVRKSRVYYLIAKKSLTFKKRKIAPPTPEPKPDEPKPDEDEDDDEDDGDL